MPKLAEAWATESPGFCGVEVNRATADEVSAEPCAKRERSPGADLAKVRLSTIRDLFSLYSFLQSPIFRTFQKQGHFRTARSGIYIGQRCMFEHD